MAYQQHAAHQFVDAGADIVFGAHPHVVEPIEIYNGKKIFYSLGNFIFDQYFLRRGDAWAHGDAQHSSRWHASLPRSFRL
jgi:poly-gamma-glutamate synthesis protein (capsule biosynthesis protein)